MNKSILKYFSKNVNDNAVFIPTKIKKKLPELFFYKSSFNEKKEYNNKIFMSHHFIF